MAEKDLNIYLTGVTAEGNAQSDPNASIGGNRSGTILKSLSVSAPVNITGVAVADASADCGAGTATLTYFNAGKTLAFAAPGDTAGAAVNVTAGGTFELYSATAGKYLIITVTAASLPALDKTDSLTFATLFDNLFNSVGSGQAQTGITQYRALIVRNDGAYTMYGAIAWLAANTPFADDEIQIGIEPLNAGAVQTIANDATAPTGVTYTLAANEAAALSLGNLSAGGGYGIWVKRAVNPTQQRFANNNFTIAIKADTV
ncbi:MAG: hypothetical protein HZA04_06095 [Nitrospinae bacterium]|nr:hypothetical protein [Nitrospinota bacterium]